MNERKTNNNSSKWNVIPTTKKCHHNNSAINSIFLENNFLLHLIESYFYEVRQNQVKKSRINNDNHTGIHLCHTVRKIFDHKNGVQKWQNFSVLRLRWINCVQVEDWFVDNCIGWSDFMHYFEFKWQQFRFCFLALIFCDLEKVRFYSMASRGWSKMIATTIGADIFKFIKE